jgi:hypothetical protein
MPRPYQVRMTQRFDMPQHSRVGHAVGIVACAILLSLAAGCASTGIEAVPVTSASSGTSLPEKAPRPAGAQRGTASATAAAAKAAEPAGPKDTGTFPNLNIPPQVAADQITDDEKAAETSDLRATQQGAATTAAGLGQGMTKPALLRKIAAQHAADALKKIDAQN